MPKVYVTTEIDKDKNPTGKTGYWFFCPGCAADAGSGMNRIDNGWSFDGNVESPTFSPSVLTWHDPGENDGRPAFRCHSYIKAGRIQFLDDCTHALKGQTVDLPELPEWFMHDRTES